MSDPSKTTPSKYTKWDGLITVIIIGLIVAGIMSLIYVSDKKVGLWLTSAGMILLALFALRFSWFWIAFFMLQIIFLFMSCIAIYWNTSLFDADNEDRILITHFGIYLNAFVLALLVALRLLTGTKEDNRNPRVWSGLAAFIFAALAGVIIGIKQPADFKNRMSLVLLFLILSVFFLYNWAIASISQSSLFGNK